MIFRRIIILGAGPTGLGAASRLDKLGYSDWQVFEKNPHVGGLSASFVDSKGFTWDIGGHVLFSHYDYFDKAVEEALCGSYYEHLRESWIRILQTWIPYPFQNNIRHLPAFALEECLSGLRDLQGDPKSANNFSEWMKAVFGSGIIKYFMEPYNKKVWGVPLESMGKGWIGERVSTVDLARIEKNIAEGKDDVSWGPNNKFKFPKCGGTGAIFQGVARPLADRISLKSELVKADLESKEVTFSNGIHAKYDVLINTIPLDQFLGTCVRTPEAVRSAASDLVHNSCLVVGLGIEGQRADTKCWMYFPENNSPFYRVTNFHNYSPRNVPGGHTDKYFSLMAETTYSPYKPAGAANIVEETVQGLINSGMLNNSDAKSIISKRLIDVPYSYPVPAINRDRALSVIQPYLESRDVYSRGRFGAWKYEVGNMDHSFMQGVEAVERILIGKAERTVNNLM